MTGVQVGSVGGAKADETGVAGVGVTGAGFGGSEAPSTPTGLSSMLISYILSEFSAIEQGFTSLRWLSILLLEFHLGPQSPPDCWPVKVYGDYKQYKIYSPHAGPLHVP